MDAIDRAGRRQLATRAVLLTKDSGFPKKQGVHDELKKVSVKLVDDAAPIYWKHK